MRHHAHLGRFGLICHTGITLKVTGFVVRLTALSCAPASLVAYVSLCQFVGSLSPNVENGLMPG